MQLFLSVVSVGVPATLSFVDSLYRIIISMQL